MDLSRKRVRDRLKIKPDPYTLKIGPGAYLTFRRGPDTWGARYRDNDGKQHHQPFAEIGSDDFDGAKKAADAWIAQMGNSAVRSIKRGSVKDALEAYVSDLQLEGKESTAREARGRFKLTVYKDRIADVKLESATRDDFIELRDRLWEGRKARSVNRQYRQIIAGLNRAHELGHVGNPAAWRLKALTDDAEAEDGGTAIFLSAAQRAALIKAADQYTAAFLRGLELTGARPKELAALTARDFDGKTLRFSHRKGKGGKVRVRYTVLGPDGVAFFAGIAADKLPAAPLFTEDGIQTWRRHIWARQVRAAAKNVNEEARGAARIPAGVGAYAFRHARISELLQVYNVDPITVGQQTGTSVAMIEMAYMRFIPQALQDKLSNLKAQA